MSYTITVSYEIADGYVGPRRPQAFKTDPEDYVGMTVEEIKESLQQQADEDMMQIVSADIDKIDDVAQQIHEAAVKIEAESDAD